MDNVFFNEANRTSGTMFIDPHLGLRIPSNTGDEHRPGLCIRQTKTIQPPEIKVPRSGTGGRGRNRGWVHIR